MRGPQRLLAALSLAFALAAFASPATARDYGAAGALFPVVEADLLEAIRARLMTLEKTGATRRLNEELKRRTIARINRPQPVEGLVRAEAARSWWFDPTITLETDIADDKGRLIMARGTRVNPLDTVPLRQALVFLDGDDPAQLAWALERAKRSQVKLILAKGAPLELMRMKQTRFYFDQGGTLIRHFRVRALPALVVQESRQLKVSEIALPQGSAAKSQPPQPRKAPS